MAKVLVSNFSKGEFGPQLYARTDVPQYNAGAKQLKNFVIQRYGGVRFRPGFRFAGEIDDIGKNYRLIPFLFSANQAYVEVMGPNQLRLQAQGGFVVEDDLKILSITKEAQAIIEAPYHGMSVGDRVFIDGVEGMTEINGRFAIVLAVIDPNHVRVNIDTTFFSDLNITIHTAGITRTAPPPAPPAPPAPLPEPTTTNITPVSSGTSEDTSTVDRWWSARGGAQLV